MPCDTKYVDDSSKQFTSTLQPRAYFLLKAMK